MAESAVAEPTVKAEEKPEVQKTPEETAKADEAKREAALGKLSDQFDRVMQGKPKDEPKSSEKDEKQTETEDTKADETKPAEKDSTKGADDKPGTEKDEKVKKDEKAEEFDSGLLERAKSVGWTDEEARAFGTSAGLDKALTLMDRKIASLGRETGSAGDTEPKPKADDAEPKGKDGTFKWEAGLDEFDPVMVKALKESHADLTAKVETLTGLVEGMTKTVGGVVESHNQQRQTAAVARFDSYIKGLGEDWETVFGKGAMRDIAQGSDNWNARVKLEKGMIALSEGYIAQGIASPEVEELAKRALGAEFGEHKDEITRKAAAKGAEKRSKQRISKPAQRTGSSASPDARAIALNEGFDKDHGL